MSPGVDRAEAALAASKGSQAAGLIIVALKNMYPTAAKYESKLKELFACYSITWPEEQPIAAAPREPVAPMLPPARNWVLVTGPEPTEGDADEAPGTPAEPPPAAPRRKNRPGHVNAKDERNYLPGGYYRMPNDFTDTLLAVMPGPVLKAYIYAHRLARIDGTFFISHGTLASKIGCKTTRHGERVMARLQQSGLVKLLKRGSARSRTANTYQLVPLEQLDHEAVQKTLDRPLAPHRQGATGPACR